MQQFAGYRPSQAVLDKLKNITLVAVVGPTGVGKTTLMQAAAASHPELQFVIADTSRPPRPEEKPGIDYNFCSLAEMRARAKRREYINVISNTTGDLYATDPASFPAGGIGMMAILADAMPYFCSLPFKKIRSIFVAPPGTSEWQKRITGHHFAPEQLTKRLAEARHSFEFCLQKQLNIVINDQVDEATNELLRLCLGKPPQTNQTAAQKIVAGILQDL